MTFMQLSILVPMVVVWQRRKHFPPPVKLLSWYVYISAFFVISARLAAIYLHNNLYFLTGFNVTKMLLFAAVYRLVLTSPRMRRVLTIATVVALCTVAGALAFGAAQALPVSRVVQCALLAGFALAYLEQLLNRADNRRLSQDSLGLLSLGQLIYSATTVSVFSLEVAIQDSWPVFHLFSDIFMASAGLALNYFLTLAFLRATPDIPAPAAVAVAGGRLVVS
ncbi:hypothetical protein GCM10028824_16080 [Hymenobacter segetis]|uniref:Uncharacterized protein n=1 Tax=Hymenobacter segetis TaxID=2025509 RepID=A0ABU9LSJ6_9BACT